ncbi:MAG: helix-turn-helix transcriptional regulator [Ruminococcaceae bacterium]|nr:helix-turn-helix transcriptional regulator [Oscillospiraceae bacterium]
MYEKRFVNRLTELRMQKGVSARDMSLSIGQSESYINKIENGVSLPSMSTFFYICEYLNITPAQFFEDEIECPEMLTKTVENLKQLSTDQLSHINTIIEDIKR